MGGWREITSHSAGSGDPAYNIALTPNQHRRPRIFIFVLLAAAISACPLPTAAQTFYTPKPGSVLRQAICDAARVFVLSKYATAALPQPIVFKIDRLAVTEDYANLQAIPLFKDGRYVDPSYLPDIAFNFCLRRVATGWEVIADLSRSDVPGPSQITAIRARLPRDFPRALLSADWQKMLRE